MLRSIIKLRGLTTLVAVSLLLASVAEAQQQKKRQRGQRGQRGQSRQRSGGFGGGQQGAPGALQLIGREEVRKELKITEEQQGIITELTRSSRPNFRELFGDNFRDLSREEREKKLAELRTTSAKKAKESEADLYGLILDEGQANRLKQIVLQQKGNRALTEPATVKALGLSSTQVTKIKSATSAGQKKQQDLTAGLRGAFGGQRGQRGKTDKKKGAAKSKDKKKDTKKRPSREELTKRFAEIRTKGEAIRAETDKAIAAVLTASQKTKFEELKGPKFELARRTRGTRGGSRKGQKGGRKRPQRPGGTKKKRNEA